MAIFKCKMCGGDLSVADGITVAACEYCGTQQTVPSAKSEIVQNLYNRANNLRIKCEFDKAEQIYEKILNEDDTQAEAHWGVILCKYGIEYVEDPKTYKRIPTCHRTSYEAITADADYLAAISHADAVQKGIYEAEAKAIDEIQKNILNIVKNEKPFDVFLCYKESDEAGKRTVDSTIANDIYYQLTQEGLKVFYAAITLEDKLGQEYEPYIFAALNSAKVMLVIGTKPEYFTAVWVKNEWSRFLKLMKTDRSKLLIPCYRDMDAYDLPEEFAHLQAQDMGKIGFINDVVRGIKKVTAAQESPTVKETVVVEKSGNAASADPLLKRAFMFLEDGDFARADEFCEQVLNLDPECAEAYLGKLMAELRVRKKDDLANQAQPFDEKNNYQKAVRFANDALANELKGYIDHINERNNNRIYTKGMQVMNDAQSEQKYKKAADIFRQIPNYKDAAELVKTCEEKAIIAKKDWVYNNGLNAMNRAKDEEEFKSAAEIFASVREYKDAAEREKTCLEKAEEARKDAILAEGIKEMDAAKTEKEFLDAAKIFEPISGYKNADQKAAECVEKAESVRKDGIYDQAVSLASNEYIITTQKQASDLFESISGWKDADEKAAACKKRIEELEQIIEQKCVNARKRAKRNKKIAIITLTSLAVLVLAVLLTVKVIIPTIKYNDAVTLVESKNYIEAINAFEQLDGFKDSASMVISTRYLLASSQLENKEYKNAYDNFKLIKDYEDSQIKRQQSGYSYAQELMADKKYREAIDIFSSVGDYEKSADLKNQCYLEGAKQFYANKEYYNAIAWYEKVKSYDKNADFYVDSCYNYGVQQIKAGAYDNALTYLSRVESYSEAKEQINAAKYEYVNANKNNTDNKTFEYLKELKAEGYKDSANIYNELYAWKVDIVVNDSEDDDITDMSSISKYSNWYFHVDLSGGEPGAEIQVKYTGYFPNGDTYSDKWDSKWSDGWGGTCWFYYNTPAYGQQGTFKLKVFDGSGNLLGEKSVKITG